MRDELSATAKVILGMLALGKQTGYDIKQLTDRATRHFWSASYGQIYPELRRLERRGLVTSRPEPSGERPRTVYDLTSEGRRTLERWLESEEEPLYEVRCESLLKIFFSDAAGGGGTGARLTQLRRYRELHERKLEQLEAIGTPGRDGPLLTLTFGIDVARWTIEWCREAERALAGTVTEEAMS